MNDITTLARARAAKYHAHAADDIELNMHVVAAVCAAADGVVGSSLPSHVWIGPHKVKVKAVQALHEHLWLPPVGDSAAVAYGYRGEFGEYVLGYIAASDIERHLVVQEYDGKPIRTVPITALKPVTPAMAYSPL